MVSWGGRDNAEGRGELLMEKFIAFFCMESRPHRWSDFSWDKHFASLAMNDWANQKCRCWVEQLSPQDSNGA